MKIICRLFGHDYSNWNTKITADNRRIPDFYCSRCGKYEYKNENKMSKKLSHKKQRKLAGLMHNFIKMEEWFYEREYAKGNYGVRLPDVQNFQKFMIDRAPFMENYECQFIIENIRLSDPFYGQIWTGITLRLNFVSINRRTLFEKFINSSELKNSIELLIN